MTLTYDDLRVIHSGLCLAIREHEKTGPWQSTDSKAAAAILRSVDAKVMQGMAKFLKQMGGA
jgi:hypothetical protein